MMGEDNFKSVKAMMGDNNLMRGKSFSFKESACEYAFRQMGQTFNANTPENHPLLFASEQDYKAAMTILAVCAVMHPMVKIYAFQLMSNHVHFVIGGEECDIHDFFDYFVGRLDKYFEGQADLREFKLKLFPINDLAYLRNAIVYNNRNGFVVNSDVTPFSYPWGSSAYFFQPLARRYTEMAGKPIGNTMLRALIHSRNCDEHKDLLMVDGYVSPLEFCHIAEAESVFIDAKQYFYLISRNVETYAEIAKSIGESVYFNDNDLYLAAVSLAKEHYGTNDLKLLSAAGKIELAKRLHYDYNAGDKQLQRLLKLDSDVLRALF